MSVSEAPTPPNPFAEEWVINDSVIRLRVWGTGRTYPLYADQPGALIGSGASCEIKIQDPTRRASREHVRLQRVQGRWVVSDRSRNGLFRDGAKIDKFILSPGIEIGLGGVTLIAESDRLMALRGMLARMLGWSAASAAAIDLALRAIRFAAQRRSSLVLVGEEVVPLAEELHRLTLGARRPFVFCNPRRQTGESTWNPMRCVATGRAALEQAEGGTICYSTRLPPADLRVMTQALHQPGCQTQLVVCADRADEAEKFAAPIVVPALGTRKEEELDRIIQEYAADAAGPLDLGDHWLSTAERSWMRGNLRTLAEIQKATTRLAAIRQGGSMTAGARRLGISHNALGRWLRTHKFPARLLRG